MGVHRFQQFLAIEPRQNIRPEPGTKRPVAGVELRLRQELAIGLMFLVVIQDSSLDLVVEHSF
ncbi:MAG TPA: hypothetical protein VFT74_16685 [Isosphaeraceae bacterium]|nr:hypothetical protein [Isosphaeraceae bacterium]